MTEERKVVYAEHIRLRMKLRGIPKALPRQIWAEATERYYDQATKHYVAVMDYEIKKRVREFVLSYDENDEEVRLITVHPIKLLQKLSRIKTGRWKKL